MNSASLNLNEIIRTAVQIRRAATSLYWQLANSARNDTLREVFLGLARWEQSQGRVFAGLVNASVFQQQSLGLADDRAEDSHDMADRLFGTAIQPVFQDARRAADVLALATYLEEHVAFTFTSIRRLLADADDKLALDHILDEESRYIAFLNQQWTALEEGRPMALAPSARTPRTRPDRDREEMQIHEPAVGVA
jgi:hypothetical protein